jgi:hypothetical protein
MHVRLPIRLVAGMAVAVCSSLAAAVAPVGIAGAGVTSVSCAGLRTDASARHFFLSRCTGSGHGATGSTGTQSVLGTGHDEVLWKSGRTSFLRFTFAYPTNDCPIRAGYTKFIKVTYSGTVTGGTAKGLVGGSYSGTVCGYQVTGTGALAGFPVGPQDY